MGYRVEWDNEIHKAILFSLLFACFIGILN